MRLVCPNCDAEYEVDAALIPDAGRDVQCSNCGHAWFQASPLQEAEAEEEQALFAPAMPQPLDLDDEEEGGYDTPPPPPLTTAPAPATRNIDSSVLSVLREEADRESRARKAEGNSLQMQDELGLAGRAPGIAGAAGAAMAAPGLVANPAPSPVADRIARMKGDAEIHSAPETAGGRGAPAKSEMLPEIDAINSTLRAKSERRTGEAAAVAESMAPDRAPGGFRRGFLLAMMLIILAAALYMLAPMLVQRVPALAGPLSAYVAAIDGLRGSVDGVMQGLIARMTGLIGGG